MTAKTVQDLINEIERLHTLVPQLKTMDPTSVIYGQFDEGGYTDGGMTMKEFELEVLIDEDDVCVTAKFFPTDEM